MNNLIFWVHIFVSLIFFAFYFLVFYEKFVKPKKNSNLVKIKLGLILFVWSFSSFLGIVLLFPKGSQSNLQEVCGMFWLAEIAAFFVFVVLEIFFIMTGFVFIYFIRNLNYSNHPVSIFEEDE